MAAIVPVAFASAGRARSLERLATSSSSEDEDLEMLMGNINPSNAPITQRWLPRPDLPRGRRLRFNVCGLRFEAWERALHAVPDTALSESTRRAELYDSASDSYIVDRAPAVFEAVLNFFHTGHLHKPGSVCMRQFHDELRFYGIDLRHVAMCCRYKPARKARKRHHHHKSEAGPRQAAKRERADRADRTPTRSSSAHGNAPLAQASAGGRPGKAVRSEEEQRRHHRRIQRRWQYLAILARASSSDKRQSVADVTNAAVLQLLDKGRESFEMEELVPHTADPAPAGAAAHSQKWKSASWVKDRIWRITDEDGWPESRHAKASQQASTIFTIISVTAIVISTVSFCLETLPQYRLEDVEVCSQQGATTSCFFNERERDTPPFSFFVIEAICVSWFTFELLIRFFACPNKSTFVRGPLNIIDLVAIVPFYISISIDAGQAGSLVVIRVVRLVRVFRVFKLSRHSVGLQVLGTTLKSSLSVLGTLVFFLVMGVVVFGSAVFYAEKDVEGTEFRSIPLCFWWAIVTMTTLGYGDIVPVTVAGRLIGAFTSVIGVLTMSLPVPIFAQKFQQAYFYQEEEDKREFAERRSISSSGDLSDDWYENQLHHNAVIHGNQPLSRSKTAPIKMRDAEGRDLEAPPRRSLSNMRKDSRTLSLTVTHSERLQAERRSASFRSTTSSHSTVSNRSQRRPRRVGSARSSLPPSRSPTRDRQPSPVPPPSAVRPLPPIIQLSRPRTPDPNPGITESTI